MIISDQHLHFFDFSKTEQAIPGHDTMLIEEFEPDVFRQIIEYIHTSSLTLQPRTLLGKDNLSSKNKTLLKFLKNKTIN